MKPIRRVCGEIELYMLKVNEPHFSLAPPGLVYPQVGYEWAHGEGVGINIRIQNGMR